MQGHITRATSRGRILRADQLDEINERERAYDHIRRIDAGEDPCVGARRGHGFPGNADTPDGIAGARRQVDAAIAPIARAISSSCEPTTI